MSEFWLISAPGDKENLQALERLNTVTSKSNLSYNTKFAIPDFKVQFGGWGQGGRGRLGGGVSARSRGENKGSGGHTEGLPGGEGGRGAQGPPGTSRHRPSGLWYLRTWSNRTEGRGRGCGSSVFTPREEHLTHLSSCELLSDSSCFLFNI